MPNCSAWGAFLALQGDKTKISAAWLTCFLWSPKKGQKSENIQDLDERSHTLPSSHLLPITSASTWACGLQHFEKASCSLYRADQTTSCTSCSVHFLQLEIVSHTVLCRGWAHMHPLPTNQLTKCTRPQVPLNRLKFQHIIVMYR